MAKNKWKRISITFIVISILLLLLSICIFISFSWYINKGSVPIEKYYDASCASLCLYYGYNEYGVLYDKNKNYESCSCDTPFNNASILAFGSSIKIDIDGNIISI